jgi:hypothetical protein
MASYKGKSGCDLLIKNLNELSAQFNAKIKVEGNKARSEFERLNSMVDSLEKSLGDKEKSGNIVESSSKKSIDLKSSRRSSRSREKREDKSK